MTASHIVQQIWGPWERSKADFLHLHPCPINCNCNWQRNLLQLYVDFDYGRHKVMGLLFIFLCRHMLNVTWEHNDFSFNSNGYLVNPAMIIITLDRERQWDKVKTPAVSVLLLSTCNNWRETRRAALLLLCLFHWRLPPLDKRRVISHITGLFIKASQRSQDPTDNNEPFNERSSHNHTHKQSNFCLTSLSHSEPPTLQKTLKGKPHSYTNT